MLEDVYLILKIKLYPETITKDAVAFSINVIFDYLTHIPYNKVISAKLQ